ncbi:MAG: hypothetical protein JNL12_04740 [Planctomycetes bacterium]|nr:hypothetical protein [Planctomycetota bacterium]
MYGYETVWGRVRGEQMLLLILLPNLFLRPPVSGILAAILFGLWLAFCLFLWRQREGAPAVLRSLQRLRRELPWLRVQPVNAGAMPAPEPFRELLARHGYALLSIDGEKVQSFHDLAMALEAQLGADAFPKEPRARVTSILRLATTTKPVRRALLWRNAGASDPQLVAAFTADWSAEGVACQPGLLVLLDFPAKPAGPVEPAPQREPALLTNDAEGWWKPVPGELAR